jgi:DNA-binding LacI/PurR family transcriptional regulator
VMSNKIATICDVANRAGVSRQTVSRVLNEPGLVRQDTALRVMEAVTALSYTPNEHARSLGQRSKKRDKGDA